MAAIPRNGVPNSTYVPGQTDYSAPSSRYNTPGDELAVDIDRQNNNTYNLPSTTDSTYQPSTVKSMESIIDRILKRGPPQSSLGNPGPLGLAAFAATTFMLSCFNAGLMVSTTSNIVLPMALWYGGFSQLAAGMWEFAANNTFGAVAFTSYGAFWLSYATIGEFYAPTGYATGVQVEASIGLYLLSWSVFTFYMMIGSMRMSYGLFILFFLLEITFILLTAGAFLAASPVAANLTTRAGGWFGIFTAFVAWYCSAAVIINSTFGCQILPIGVLGPLQPTTPLVSRIGYLHRQVTKSNVNLDDASITETQHNSPMAKQV